MLRREHPVGRAQCLPVPGLGHSDGAVRGRLRGLRGGSPRLAHARLGRESARHRTSANDHRSELCWFTTGGDAHWTGIFFAAGLLYVTYEGFGVVTNSAADMRNPKKQLPRAMYTALFAVSAIYVVVSTLVVVLMSVSEMEKHQGHVLAIAGQAVMGKTGFILLGSAAMLATASAVNATLFGDANLGFDMSKNKELPGLVGKGIWRGGTWATLIGAGLTILFVAFFPLSAVGQMASLAFLGL